MVFKKVLMYQRKGKISLINYDIIDNYNDNYNDIINNYNSVYFSLINLIIK